MCTGQPPATVPEALAGLRASLAFLNQVAAADLPGAVQAGCLRELAKAESAYTAAHARMLAAFSASGAHEDDGQQSERAWLKWQTQITTGAAGGAVGWMKRLAAHPAVRTALADGTISPSWARHICTWTDVLPEDGRDDADQILLAAAASGAVLPDLAALAEEMHRRTATPDPDGPHGDDSFDERRVRLGLTFGGAGVLEGDLTPACAAALQAVLEALGKKAGPEDVRTAPQRRHDALEEACRRLIGAGCLPDRAGQPTQVQLHLTLDQLRDLPGATDAEAAWRAGQAAAATQPPSSTTQAAQAAAEGQPGWLTGGASQPTTAHASAATPSTTSSADPAGEAAQAGQAGPAAGQAAAAAQAARAVAEGQAGWLTGRAAQAYACDAAITPIVTGTVDQTALAALAAELLADLADSCTCGTRDASRQDRSGQDGSGQDGGYRNRSGGEHCRCADTGPPSRTRSAGHPDPRAPLHPTTLARLHETLLRHAADILSGPSGLAAFLRTRLTADQFPSVSLPLDTGTPTSLITGGLRRAVITRDRHCAFPGCDIPPNACQVHHIKERARGGQTCLGNLVLLCAFHHLIAVHQWGWSLALHGDGTVTAISPDGTRTLHSHGPPSRAA
jgi:hypothetical protein